MALTELFCDSTAAANGTGTRLDPFRDIDFAFSKLTRNNDSQILRLRAGRAYGAAAVGATIRQLWTHNVTIEPYWLTGDQTDRPMLDGINYLPADTPGWVLEGPNDDGDGFIWSFQLGTASSVKRVFAATNQSGLLLPQRVLGEALRCAPNKTVSGLRTATTDTLASIKANLNKDDVWYGAGSALTYKLYMWTERGDQNPSVYYQGLGVVQRGAGTVGISGMSMYFTKNMVIRSLAVQGPESWAFQIASADNATTSTEDVLFEDCYSRGALFHYKVDQTATAAYATILKRIQFKGCTADNWTSPREQEPNVSYDKLAASDQFLIVGAVEDVLISDCVSINPTHSAAAVLGTDAVHAKPRRSGVLRHKSTAAPWVTYSRAVGMDNCDATCFIRDGVYIGANVQSQFSGGGQVTGNKWLGLRPAMRKPSTGIDADGWVMWDGFRTGQGSGLGTDNGVDLAPENFVFANNACDGSYGTPIQVNIYTPTVFAGTKAKSSFRDNALLFANNLLIDTKPGRAGKPYVKTFQQGGFTVGTQMFHNNLIYNGTNTPSSANWNGVTYPSLHDAPGHSNNLTVDPSVDADLRPRAGSPLIRAGRYCGVTKDSEGKRFGMRPAIGAYEVSGPVVRQRRQPA